MRLTPQEMKKYEQALERQRKEIWEKSKKIVIRDMVLFSAILPKARL